jgi:subtilisin family serine protease
MRARKFLLIIALGACSSGGGSIPGTVVLSGQLTVLAGVPLTFAPSDLEPNDSAASARLLRGPGGGRLDVRTDPSDVFRRVARAAGPVTAVLEATGFQGEVVLHDLETGAVARTLDLERGSVFDIVVVAHRGEGTYNVRLQEQAGDPTPRALPKTYRDCGEGFVRGQMVASLLPGVTPAALAQASGMACLRGGERACLLEAPVAGAADEFGALCELLTCCARLEADGLVRYAEPNYVRRLTDLPNDPLYGSQWALEQIRAPAAWEHVATTSRIVAVVDSGIRQHPDLVDQLVAGYDFEEGDDDPTDPNPRLSHGTQTAGVVAASGNNGTGVTGVFWDGLVMPLRAFDESGFGTSFSISNAILFAAGLPNSSGTLPPTPAVAINLSFASPIATQAEEDACAAARAAGLFLAAAAGNESSIIVRYPAGYDSVMSVAATAIDGTATGYSNRGAWIDIAAPGGTRSNGVRTTGIDTSGQFSYPFVDGTSFASPHVAAVGAMLMSLQSLTPAEVEQILVDTARDVGDPGFDTRTGHGILDAYAAVLSALALPPPVLIPFEPVQVRLIQLPLNKVVFSAETTEAEQLQWTLGPVGAGLYILEAGTDRNFDGDISDPGEVFGRWTDEQGGDVLEVVPGATLPALDFTIGPR